MRVVDDTEGQTHFSVKPIQRYEVKEERTQVLIYFRGNRWVLFRTGMRGLGNKNHSEWFVETSKRYNISRTSGEPKQ